MSIGAFTDRTQRPSTEEILAMLGISLPLWEALVDYVEGHYRVKREWAFYGKNYGWAVRYRRNGKALISLYPAENGFTAQVVLGEEGIATALESGVGEATRQAIKGANPYPEGRWLFISVNSEDTLKDVERLLELKGGASKSAVG